MCGSNRVSERSSLHIRAVLRSHRISVSTNRLAVNVMIKNLTTNGIFKYRMLSHIISTTKPMTNAPMMERRTALDLSMNHLTPLSPLTFVVFSFLLCCDMKTYHPRTVLSIRIRLSSFTFSHQKKLPIRRRRRPRASQYTSKWGGRVGRLI